MEKEPTQQEKDHWEKERQKCLDDPHYFYTTYFMINGMPATTSIPKEVFNEYFSELPVPPEAYINEKLKWRRSTRTRTSQQTL